MRFLSRAVRMLRAAGHVANAVFRVVILFPWLAPSQRRAAIQHWSVQALAIFDLQMVFDAGHGVPAGRPCLYAANHVSWLDIFAIWTLVDTQFVAKVEVSRWPVIGMLARHIGILFIDRTKLTSAVAAGRGIAIELAAGHRVCIFPEGTTTEGRDLQPFRPALFQPAVDAGTLLQPLAIRYSRADGTVATEAAYIGDMSLLRSMWQLTGAGPLAISVAFLPPIGTIGRGRGELAQLAHDAVKAHLAALEAAARPVAFMRRTSREARPRPQMAREPN